MALIRQKDRDHRDPLSTELFDGFAWTRAFLCPKGEVETALAAGGDLAEGSYLAEIYGGPAAATRTVCSPMLQGVVKGQQSDGGKDLLIAVYHEITAEH